MAGIQACVGTFTLPLGPTTGPQTVTGIADVTGTPFTPKAIIIWGTYSGQYAPGGSQVWDSLGLDDGTQHSGQCLVSQYEVGTPWRGTVQSTAYSILTCQSIFSAAARTEGYISAFGSGSFTYTLDLNEDGTETFGFLALGGDALLVTSLIFGSGIAGTAVAGETYTVTGVGFPPTGGIFLNNVPANGAYNGGNNSLSLGFCDSACTQYSQCASTQDDTAPVNAVRHLHSGVIVSDNDAIGAGQQQDSCTLTGWTSDGFTATCLNGLRPKAAALLIGGVTTLVGTFAEPATNGSQTVPIAGMVPAAVLLMSVGATAAAGSPETTSESWAVGAYDGIHAWAYWHGLLQGGTSTTNGGAVWGAANVLQFAQNNGPDSTTVTKQGTLTGTALTNGAFAGTWSQTDGTARSVAYFAFGLPATPPPPPTTVAIRRRRIVPLPFAQHQQLFLGRLELLMQLGMGTTTSVDPQVLVRLSKDGGFTWNAERSLRVGKMGEYLRRCYSVNLGQGRQWVLEVSMTDPVASYWLDAFVAVVQGTS